MRTFFHLSLNLQQNSLLREGEYLFQDEPADEKQYSHQREHEQHPFAKAQSEVQAFGIVQVFQRDGVRWCADRSADSAQVGSNRDAECHGYAAFSLGRELLKHRCQEREHHGCGSGVRHKHGEKTCNEYKAQQHILAFLSERFQQHLCQMSVETCLGSSDGQHESTDEKHDDRVGERGHDALIRQQCAYLVRVYHPLDAAVAGENEHQSDD